MPTETRGLGGLGPEPHASICLISNASEGWISASLVGGWEMLPHPTQRVLHLKCLEQGLSAIFKPACHRYWPPERIRIFFVSKFHTPRRVCGCSSLDQWFSPSVQPAEKGSKVGNKVARHLEATPVMCLRLVSRRKTVFSLGITLSPRSCVPASPFHLHLLPLLFGCLLHCSLFLVNKEAQAVLV